MAPRICWTAKDLSSPAFRGGNLNWPFVEFCFRYSENRMQTLLTFFKFWPFLIDCFVSVFSQSAKQTYSGSLCALTSVSHAIRVVQGKWNLTTWEEVFILNYFDSGHNGFIKLA